MMKKREADSTVNRRTKERKTERMKENEIGGGQELVNDVFTESMQ